MLRTPRQRPVVDTLEHRIHLAAQLNGSTLVVEGTNSADVITLKTAPNGQSLRVTISGVTQRFGYDQFDSILINARGRNDVVNTALSSDEAFISKTITIHLGNGNDRLTAGANVEQSITGGAGNDIISVVAGSVSVDLGDGFNVYTGSSGTDYVEAGYQDDVINTRGGNDTVAGGPGNDSISGGAGDDELYGHDENDTLLGGPGNDDLYGNSGDDLLDGGRGNDSLIGNSGANRLSGGAGVDILHSMEGSADTLSGGADDDILNAQPNSVILDR